jgi:ankyrin repeat protein
MSMTRIYADDKGMTALMHAVYAHSVEHARILLDHGANVTARNGDGQAAADLAERSSDHMKKLISDAIRR